MDITVTDSTSDIVVETVENSTTVTIQQSVVEVTAAPGTNDHAHLSNLDYANSGHTGFEAAGAASSAIASHVGQADPHTQYALESALPTRLFGGAFTDTVVPGAGDDAKFGRWNNSLQRLEWASASASPGGSSGQVQYNNGSGGLAGHSGMTYDGAGRMTLSTSLTVPVVRPPFDSTAAWRVTKADGSTDVIVLDTVSNALNMPVNSSIKINGVPLLGYNSSANTFFGLTSGISGPLDTYFSTGRAMYFRVNGNTLTFTTALMLRQDGNVGIGTTSPNSKLDVSGTVQMDGLRIDVTPTSETVTCTHTITFSANGNNYKIPCLPA